MRHHTRKAIFPPKSERSLPAVRIPQVRTPEVITDSEIEKLCKLWDLAEKQEREKREAFQEWFYSNDAAETVRP